MTTKNILLMTVYRLMVNDEYVAEIRKRNQENPDLSEYQLSAKLSELVILYVTKESEFIKELLKEIPKAEKVKAMKEIIMEYAKTTNTKIVINRSPKKAHSTPK